MVLRRFGIPGHFVSKLVRPHESAMSWLEGWTTRPQEKENVKRRAAHVHTYIRESPQSSRATGLVLFVFWGV